MLPSKPDFASLIRCGAVTHHFDQDQRCIRLEITARPQPDQVIPTVANRGWLFASVVFQGGWQDDPGGTTNFNWSPSALMDIRPPAASSWSWQMQHYANRMQPMTTTTMNLSYPSAVVMPYVVYEDQTGQPIVQSLWSWAHPLDPPAVDEVMVLGGHDAQPPAVSTHSDDALDFVWKIRDPQLSLAAGNASTKWEMWSKDVATNGNSPTGLNFKRKYTNLVLLPDCTAVVIGGSANEFHPYNTCGGNPPETDAIPEMHPEMLDFLQPTSMPNEHPVWLPLPTEGSPRLYHSVAFLMKDGRVWSGGGYRQTINGTQFPSGCSLTSVHLQHTDAEIFVPRYAQATGLVRPAIVGDVSAMQYGTPLTLHVAIGDDTSPADDIDFATLIRCGAVTHHFDWDQRCIRLEITARPQPDQVTLARLPTVANRGNFLAPPGWYLLFVVRKPAGQPTVRLPSIGRFVQVQ